jgi:RPA family protein
MKQRLIGRYITATASLLGDYYIAKTVKADTHDATTAPAVSSKRNVAHRISASAFGASKADSEPIEGFEHDAKFIVTPKGVKVNRVFVVGALLELAETSDSGSGTVKARLVDHTGHFLLMAGDFLPEARQKLSETKAPCYIAVIGKVAWFEAGDGKIVKYIRPEEVAVVDESVQKMWKSEIAEVV